MRTGVVHLSSSRTCRHITEGTSLANNQDKCRKAGAASRADICIWDTTTCCACKVLSYHPLAVQGLAFSPDGCWLVSIGKDPERTAVIWDVAGGTAVAIGRAQGHLQAVAWRHGGDKAAFVTVGEDGALLWALEATHLAQQKLTLPQVRS